MTMFQNTYLMENHLMMISMQLFANTIATQFKLTTKIERYISVKPTLNF